MGREILKANKACLSGVPFHFYKPNFHVDIRTYATNPMIQEFHHKFIVSRFNSFQ